ncbi:uncharacterized protein LOC129608746 [Condylostylus longicornis]|uniref:uncharacterized protein LOC129608746 n=1 Tax=Condylostylus longicornis TaxID=2530218 RepID=UPI00244DDF2B|nr:uncharacterized protein LOC129608746 [Condylostylus longicornis]
MSIFRRMFNRKDNTATQTISNTTGVITTTATTTQQYNGTKNGINGKISTSLSSSMSSSTTLDNNNSNNYRQILKHDNEIKNNNDNTKRNLSVLQLTPLWEHIINTRTLPDNINLNIMFNEFLERLRDPEWQVRQHALRVLVDVLLVIGNKADSYFNLLLPQLIENLGHSAPTVRKGALDCLRVYLNETSMPESVLLQILDIGLNQRITNEPFGGRLTCGVMLSLPSLVQATMGSTKRNFILKTTIDMLINKMTQITHQEITLKVLLKFKELLGENEFIQYITPSEYREFELLCSVYGITGSNHINYQVNGNDFKKSWQIIPSFDSDDRNFLLTQDLLWKSSDDEDNKGIDLPIQNDTSSLFSFTPIPSSEILHKDEPKIILETEIKINNESVTMRILEAKDDSFLHDCPYHDDNKPLAICETSTNPTIKEDLTTLDEKSGLMHILTDSELDEINKNVKDADPNVLGTPKRVTFGGEIVKMRTPDSDGTTIASDIDVIDLSQIRNDNSFNVTQNMVNKSQSIQDVQNFDTNSVNRPTDDGKLKPTSPRSPFKRMTISPVDKILSPKSEHKEIEVLHNLQRELSPNRTKDIKPKIIDITPNENEQISDMKECETKAQNTNVNSWEDLGLVDNQTLQNLRSGDWQRRSYAIQMIEESLKPPENLVLVQPYLESLLRALLSSERHASVSEDKKRVLMNLMSRLPLDNLEKQTVQILTGICRQGGPGSNRVAKLLMQRLSPSAIVLKLLSNEFLYTRSSKFRENALQIVMYALMTFPSTSFDTSTCVIGATYAALDNKKRVRQAALDILAILGQVSSPRIVMEIVQRVTDVHNNSIDKGKIDNRLNTIDFMAAVKARLSRKQLPNITSDDCVIYALRVPSPGYINNLENSQKMAADVRWIASGIGSVSPTSIKKRSQKVLRQQHYLPETSGNFRNNNDLIFKKKVYGNSGPHEVQNYGIGNDYIKIDERNHRYREMTTTGNKYSTDYRDEAIGNNPRRNVFVQSFSDSSQDDRSSDSTFYAYESGFKNSMQSRFPSMEKQDAIVNTMTDNSYESTYSSNFGKRSQVPRRFASFEKLNSRGAGENIKKAQEYAVDKAITQFERIPNVFEYCYNNIKCCQKLNCTKAEKDDLVNNDDLKTNNNGTPLILLGNSEEIINKPPQQPFIISNNVYKNTAAIDDLNTNHENHNIIETQKSPKNSIQKLNPATLTPTATKKSPSISTISHEIPIAAVSQDNLQILNFENEEYTEESSELSSDDRLNSSGHSTPTRILTDRITPLSVKESPYRITENVHKNDTMQQSENNKSNSAKSKVQSRPQSSYSNKTFKSVVVEEKINKVDSMESINKIESDIEIDNTDGPNGDFEIFENIENFDRSITPLKDLKSEENSFDAKSIGTESRTETEQFSIETVIMTNLKEDDVHTHTVVEIEMKEVELQSENDPEKFSMNDIEVKTEPASIPPLTPKSSKSPSNIRPKSPTYSHTESEQKDTEIDIRSSTSTETSSDYQQSTASADFLLNHQQNFSPVKTMMRKSKTTIFSRKNRRVSPVKHSLKLTRMDVYPQTLSKFDKPKEALSLTFHQLESPNWEIVMDGLVDIVRLIRHHPHILEPHCHLVCMHLAKSVKNLRSQVSRAACQASTEYFTVRNKFIEQECDDLVGNLLHRTADTNRFLRADAGRALESMCDNLTPPKVLNLLTLRGVTHQNAIVKTATAKLLNHLVDRVGCDKVYQMPRDQKEKIFVTACTLLMEGSLETRGYAKTLLKTLSDHPLYNRSILDYIPPRMYRNIEKSLKSIKPL